MICPVYKWILGIKKDTTLQKSPLLTLSYAWKTIARKLWSREESSARITSYNVCYTKLLRGFGQSEEIVGKALKGAVPRDRVVIATKAGLEWTEGGKVYRNASRQRLLKEIDDSLRRLQTDYIDLYP